MGFEIPEGAQRKPRALAFPVVYISANEQRFAAHRSRGHTLIKKMSDGPSPTPIERSMRTVDTHLSNKTRPS